MGNFEKLGVLVIIILAVVIVVVLIGDGPDDGLEPEKGEAPAQLVNPEIRHPEVARGPDPAYEPERRTGEDPLGSRPWPDPPLGNGPEVEPEPEPDPEPVVEDLDHTFRKGETPYSLSVRYYGNGKHYREILEANPGLNPTAIPVGKVIRIPHPSKVLGEATEAPPETPADNSEIYVVQKGDSLWKIAVKTLGSGPAHRRIHQANLDVLGADGNRLSPGMRLRIPR
jgi:nucleoid-associated protein YgaU